MTLRVGCPRAVARSPLTRCAPHLASQAQLRALPGTSARPGPSLESAFTAASRVRVYPGRKGRVPKTAVRTLLARFSAGPDDAAAVSSILAALPTVPDNLVSFRELATAVRKVSVRDPRAAALRPLAHPARPGPTALCMHRSC